MLFPVAVDVGVGQDAIQPGPQVGALGEAPEGGERLEERLLDQVLGVGRVTGHPQRRCVQLVQQGHRLVGETLRLVIMGSDTVRPSVPNAPFARHEYTRNRGTHVIHAGGRYDSYLQIPVIPRRSP